LRVTDALYEALPIDAKPLILGATDTRITWLHRLTSIHPFLRSLMEWVQQGKPQNIFTKYYRGWLRSHHQSLYKQFSFAHRPVSDPHENYFGYCHSFWLGSSVSDG